MGKYVRTKYPTKCQSCEAVFMAYKKGKHTRKYCSESCHPSAKENYECEICGKGVVRTPGNIKKRIYCSKECSDEGKKGVSINQKEKVSLKCLHCGVAYEVLPCF